MSTNSGRAIGGTAGLVAILTTDTEIAHPTTGNTFEIYQLYVHDRGGAGGTLEVFLSADATSAAAERVRYVSVGVNETKTIEGLTVPSGYYLIGKAAATGLNVTGKYTYRDGSSV